MRTIDSLRDDILNNRYDTFKEKILRITPVDIKNGTELS